MRDDYEIEARIVVDGNAFDPGARHVERRMASIESRAHGVGRSITSAIGGSLLAVASGYGLVRIGRGIVGLNSEIDDSVNGLASLFNALTGTPIAQSIGIARTELAALREDAAKGVGELADYRTAFQQVLAPGLAAGASTGQLRALVRQAIAAGSAMRGREGVRLIPFDLMQAMTAGVGERTTPLVNQALRAINMTNEAFNRLAPAQRIEALNRAFEKFAPGVALMGQTFGAQFDTLQDKLKEIARQLTRPLFDRWTEQVKAVNAWLDANEDKVNDMINRYGPALVRIWDTIAGNARTIAAAGGAVVAGGAALRVGGAASSFVPSALSMLGAGGGAGAAGVGAVSSLAIGPLIVAAGLAAAAFIGVTGAMQEFPGAVQWVIDMFGFLVDAFDTAIFSFGFLTEQGSLLNRFGLGLIAIFGALEFSVAGLVLGFALLIPVVDMLAGTLLAFINRSGELLSGQLAPSNFRAALASDVAGLEGQMAARIAMVVARFQENQAKRAAAREGDEETGSLNPKPPETTVNVGTMNISVKSEVNADPARVAIAFEEIVDRLQRNPMQARRAPRPVLG